MQTTYPLRVQAIRSKGQKPRLYVSFPLALAVAIGFKTRWSAIPPLVTMLVAAFIVHAGDGWGKQEFPILYACGFLTLVFTDGGRYAVDTWLKKRRR